MPQQLYYLIGYFLVLASLTTLVFTNHVPSDALIGAVGIILGHIGGVYTPPPGSNTTSQNATKGT